MPLEIKPREREGIEILELKGRLTFGEEDLLLRNELERLVGEKKNKLVLSLEGLDTIDTTGFETLLYARERMQATGGGLALAGLQPSHVETLMKARLEVALPLFGDEIDATNSFFPERKASHYDVLDFVRTQQPKPPG